MKKFILLIVFIICAVYNTQAQSSFCSIIGNNLSIDQAYIKPNLISSDNDFKTVSCTEHVIQTGFGNITIKCANETPEEEYGFNIISISNGTHRLLNIKQDDMWTYTFGGKSTTDFKIHTDNRFFIPISINANLSLAIFCGWPYGEDMPLLTIIAITHYEAKVIYNCHADITDLQKNPFSMTVQTNIVEHYADGTPMAASQSHIIYYNNGRFIYE